MATVSAIETPTGPRSAKKELGMTALCTPILPVLFPDCATEIRPRSIVKKQAIKSTSITMFDVEYGIEIT